MHSSNLLVTCTSCLSCGQLILSLATASQHINQPSAIPPASMMSTFNSLESDSSSIWFSSHVEEAVGQASTRGVRTSELSDEDWECATAVSSPPDRSICEPHDLSHRTTLADMGPASLASLIKHSQAGVHILYIACDKQHQIRQTIMQSACWRAKSWLCCVPVSLCIFRVCRHMLHHDTNQDWKFNSCFRRAMLRVFPKVSLPTQCDFPLGGTILLDEGENLSRSRESRLVDAKHQAFTSPP